MNARPVLELCSDNNLENVILIRKPWPKARAETCKVLVNLQASNRYVIEFKLKFTLKKVNNESAIPLHR